MPLVAPSDDLRAAYATFAADYRDHGEPERAAKYGELAAYLATAPAHSFWLVERDQLLGVVRIRPQLDANEERYDGHVGYDIAPAHRRRGHGTQILRLALAELHELGVLRVIATCLDANVGSRLTIERCGGTLLEIIDDAETGLPLRRYAL